MIDEKKLIAEIREKIRPESFGEQCNSLDVIYAMLQLIDEQPKVGRVDTMFGVDVMQCKTSKIR